MRPQESQTVRTMLLEEMGITEAEIARRKAWL